MNGTKGLVARCQKKIIHVEINSMINIDSRCNIAADIKLNQI